MREIERYISLDNRRKSLKRQINARGSVGRFWWSQSREVSRVEERETMDMIGTRIMRIRIVRLISV